MTSPQNQGTPIAMASVVEAQRRKIISLTEENILLSALLDEREKQIAELQHKE